MKEKVQTSWSYCSRLSADSEEVPALAGVQGTFIRIYVAVTMTRNTLHDMHTWTLANNLASWRSFDRQQNLQQRSPKNRTSRM